MKCTILLALMFAGLFFFAHPLPASAEFAVRNSSTYGTVSVAFAATWTDNEGTTHGESEGWWVIDETACKIIITTSDVSAYTIYIYAYATSPSTQYWGGTYDYCLDPGQKFLYQGNDMITPCSAGKSYGMRLIDTGQSSTYAYFLRD